jgi:hypothetical protein
MALPEPAPGLVICYSYLWHDEHKAGVEEGRKDRPCAIVVARIDADGDTALWVAPITHSKPDDPYAVLLTPTVKLRLGLDEQPSWIVTDELNQFIWPGPDLRPIARDRRDTFAWGFLPVDVFAAVKRGVIANARRLRTVLR